MKKIASKNSVAQSNIAEGNGYDLTKIKAFASNDPVSIREILVSLAGSMEQNIALFRQSLQTQDYKSTTELAHKMLPMLRLLEAKAVVEPLAELEQNGADGIYTNTEITGRAVLPEIEKLVEAIKTDQQITVD
jgi:hypothetical protein